MGNIITVTHPRTLPETCDLCLAKFYVSCSFLVKARVIRRVATNRLFPQCFFIPCGLLQAQCTSLNLILMGLIIYVCLLFLTPKILSLPFDPQDNVILSWAHSYTPFHNRSNCWVCGALPSSSMEGFPWWASPLQGRDFLSLSLQIPVTTIIREASS